MSFKAVGSYSSSLGFFLFFCLILVGFFFGGLTGVSWDFGYVSSWFIVDFVGVSLSLLSMLLGVCLWANLYYCGWWLSRFIFCSVVCSVFSFVSCHALLFWFFYELSIVSLLVLLVVESPYSERYSASWYLLGYVVLTGLPMLLLLVYFSLVFGTLNLNSWSVALTDSESLLGVPLIVMLGVLFITKVPLPPFHVWLPIVHAEASSGVSMCLSGYVMKLGILGLCRFCSSVLPGGILSHGYCLFFLVVSVFFFMSAVSELDGKRWLAFLSLSHIMIACVCLCVGGVGSLELSMLYCLGHGVSAGLIFLLLWWFYESCGSRSWLIVKNSVGNSLSFRVLCVGSLCSSASIPPTIQFFSEVGILVDCSWVSSSFLVLMGVYLFFGGLVPLFLLGYLNSRHVLFDLSGLGSGLLLTPCVFLCIWGYLLFLIV